MKTLDVLPCYDCGRAAQVVQIVRPPDRTKLCLVKCTACGVEGPELPWSETANWDGKTPEQLVVEGWNDRPVLTH